MTGGRNLRILFAGSPAIAVPVLRTLVPRFLAGVLTNADSPQGRHGTPLESAVAAVVRKDAPGIPVWKPVALDDSVVKNIGEQKFDLLLTFAYGKIFPQAFLDLFPVGAVNVPPSLLPKFRGPAPIPAVIRARERESGVTLQRMSAKMDAGNILAAEKIVLEDSETSASLAEKSANIASIMVQTLLATITATMTSGGGDVKLSEGTPQDETAATYCHLLKHDDGIIDWTQSAAAIDAHVRAFTPGDVAVTPLARTVWRGKPFFIHEGGVAEKTGIQGPPGTVLPLKTRSEVLIACGQGVYAARKVQVSGKKALHVNDFLNGSKEIIGARLG